MQVIRYLIGFFLGFIIVFLISILVGLVDKYNTGRFYEITNNCRMGNLGYLYNQWEEFFKEKYFRGIKFRYYGGVWQLGGASELYWVHSSFQGIEKEEPEYASDWNYWRYDFKSMKYIMKHHPNLQNERKRLRREDKIPQIISTNEN